MSARPRRPAYDATDLDLLYPACVAMYTEEVGVSPELFGGADFYRTRVRHLISRGWSFARIQDGEVVFKAEVACLSPAAAQVQGVWVAPDLRGQGLGVAGMAAVVDLVVATWRRSCRSTSTTTTSPARRIYERVGFRQTATFATVMF